MLDAGDPRRRRRSSTSSVSREESWRRNVARYQEKLKHSILAHMVPRETYDYFYDTNDWDELTGGRPSGWLDVNGVRVPFVSMNNEPESTDPAVLEERYAGALGAAVGAPERAAMTPATARASSSTSSSSAARPAARASSSTS